MSLLLQDLAGAGAAAAAAAAAAVEAFQASQCMACSSGAWCVVEWCFLLPVCVAWLIAAQAGSLLQPAVAAAAAVCCKGS